MMRGSGVRASLSLQRPRKLLGLEQVSKIEMGRAVSREVDSCYDDIVAVNEKRQLTRQILLERGQIALLQAKVQDLLTSISPEDEAILGEETGKWQELKEANATKTALDGELAEMKELYNELHAAELQNEIEFFRDILSQQVISLDKVEENIEMKRIQFEELIDSDTTIEISRKQGRIEELRQNLQDLQEEEMELNDSYERLVTETADISDLNNEIEQLERILQDLELEKSSREDELEELINEQNSTPTKKRTEIKSPPIAQNNVERSPRRVHRTSIDVETPDESGEDKNRRSRRKMRRSDSSSDDDDRFYDAMEMMMRRNREEIERQQRMSVHGKRSKRHMPLNQARGAVTASSPAFHVSSTKDETRKVRFLPENT